jgi:hypothetical protein
MRTWGVSWGLMLYLRPLHLPNRHPLLTPQLPFGPEEQPLTTCACLYLLAEPTFFRRCSDRILEHCSTGFAVILADLATGTAGLEHGAVCRGLNGWHPGRRARIGGLCVEESLCGVGHKWVPSIFQGGIRGKDMLTRDSRSLSSVSGCCLQRHASSRPGLYG